jgi:hypothetical protein
MTLVYQCEETGSASNNLTIYETVQQVQKNISWNSKSVICSYKHSTDYPTEQSLSWESIRFSASQETPHILQNLRFITTFTRALHLSLPSDSWKNIMHIKMLSIIYLNSTTHSHLQQVFTIDTICSAMQDATFTTNTVELNSHLSTIWPINNLKSYSSVKTLYTSWRHVWEYFLIA